MEENFSASYKKNMILIYIRPTDNYFVSYHLGLEKIIAQKILAKAIYGKPLLYFIATAYTIVVMRELKIEGIVFTSEIAAKWFSEKSYSERMLINLNLRNYVWKLSGKVFSAPLPEIKIWNEAAWGKVSSQINGNRFEVEQDQIKKWEDRSWSVKKIKKKKKNDGDVEFESFSW